ncbi:MAG: aminopeptidase [Chitinispirillaceae bacterium]|nr:aminopeptidase [Chitinispirillaceae bacterium]
MIFSCYGIKQATFFLKDQARSKPIERLLQDSTLTDSTRRFFTEVERICRFAVDSVGLKNNRNYTRYVPTDSSYLLVMLSAADSISFTTKKWCYLFLGCFPLRSYYDLRDAKRVGRRLARKGYEINIDQVDAFSTLGIFTDPVYSFMQEYPVFSLASLILHEQTHATVYFKNVQFSEELANFIGREGALRYLEAYYGSESQQYLRARRLITDRDVYLKLLRELYTRLGKLYERDISRVEKLKKKEVVLTDFKRLLVDRYDSLFTTELYRGVEKYSFNNAFLAVRMTYNLDLALFERYCSQQGGDLRKVVHFAVGLKKRKGDPKKYLQQAVSR